MTSAPDVTAGEAGVHRIVEAVVVVVATISGVHRGEHSHVNDAVDRLPVSA